MKKLTKLFSLLILFALINISCQKEKIEIIDNTPDDNALTVDSSLSLLLIRSTENDGEDDDFIDNGDCFSIAFPFTITINQTELIIENEDDYENILIFLEQTGGNINDIEIVFPITIILSDYTEVIINNQNELNFYIAACQDEIDDDIDCVDFVYPITLFVYDSSTEITSTVEINNDLELFTFLSTMSNTQIISIQYPISVILDDGSTIQVNSDEELEAIIINCDNNNSEPTELNTILTNDSWYVSYFFDDTDETSDFCEFEFTFNENGTVIATNGSDTVDGVWATGIDSGISYVELDFGTDIPFDELNDDWDVLNASMLEIELKDISGGNGGIDLLTLDRIPTECNSGNNSDLEEYLTTDSWYVSYYFDETDETSDFCEFEFTFNENGTVIATDGTDTIDGAWAIGIDSGITYVELDFGTDIPFDELNDNWDVLNASMVKIELEDVSGGNGGTDLLTFEREPTICEDDNTYLEQVLTEGQWIVALYLDDGIDETSDYNNYILTFNSDGTVIADNGTVINGSWDVTGNTNNLDLILDFGTSIPFDEFNDDWDVFDVQENRVEVYDVSGGNGGTDTLVFEKI